MDDIQHWLLSYEMLQAQNDRKELSLFFDKFLTALETCQLRLAYQNDGTWVVEPGVQRLINSYFATTQPSGDSVDGYVWDKVPRQKIRHARVAPGAIIRRGACISTGAVIMPSFINIGSFVGEQTMIDAWATVGSGAYIGARCHLSGGSGLGGVLEPAGARPVIVEDDCFIGARCEISEGVIVRQGAVIASGVFLSSSTRVYNRMTSEVTYGEVPAGSVVVPGTLPGRDGVSLAAAIIVKKRDAQTSSKVALNQALRDYATL
jgi:2,3,4,5-tetrahydropyridine-2-carboxylate N-succinyltransferase